ncbi:MAG: sodium:alanine symporter family protein [Phycisphaeraceae bacterium]|nr:MAG: sodium:alanine symporter family protein [Phycisphaeraceae bacterium]
MDRLIQLYHDYVPEFTDNILWGTHTFIVLLGVGLLFTIWSKFIQYRALTHGVTVIRGKYDDKKDPGAINHFQALSAALSATVGLGNIGGVAVAVAVGGPGAVFWMWVVGFLGMAIKSVEVTLAMLHRDVSDPENPHGGAMFVIKRGWGDKVGGAAKPIAFIIGAIFVVTLLISTMTGGNMFQVWNVSRITNEYFGIDTRITGIVLASLTALVIIGGIKRIGAVAGRLVPLMCGMYLLGGIVVLVVKAANIPELLWYIVRDAFNPHEATGAFLGATAWFGLTTGLRRALFSNEAGQGSSPIAHSAAKTDEPVREGVVAGLEPFIDTCLVCTLTALVILSTGTWNREAVGEFKGDVIIAQVQNDAGQTVTAVQASTSLDALPKLPAPDNWYDGNRFFLLGEVDQIAANTGTNRVRVGGRLVTGDTDADGDGLKDLVIAWDTPPDGVRLLNKGVYRDIVGAPLTGHAFDRAIPGLGKYLVTMVCWLFAFSTMISWSYYGEQGVVFLFGKKLAGGAVLLYKLIFCALAIVASWPGFLETDAQLGLLADLGTGVMLFANVPIIVFMGYQSMRAFNDYFSRLRRGEMEPPHQAPPMADVIEGRDVK